MVVGFLVCLLLAAVLVLLWIRDYEGRRGHAAGQTAQGVDPGGLLHGGGMATAAFVVPDPQQDQNGGQQEADEEAYHHGRQHLAQGRLVCRAGNGDMHRPMARG